MNINKKLKTFLILTYHYINKMSISCMINEPKNQIENDFFFPIATESVYEYYWYKFAKDNNLMWLQLSFSGVVLEKIYFDDMLNELSFFQAFLVTTDDEYYLQKKDYIFERISLFITKLQEAKNFRYDIELYIG